MVHQNERQGWTRARRDSRRPRNELTIRRRTPVERVRQRCSSPTFAWFAASMAFKCAGASSFQPGMDAPAPEPLASVEALAIRVQKRRTLLMPPSALPAIRK